MQLYKLATSHFQEKGGSIYFLAAEREPTSDEIREIVSRTEPRSGRQNPQKIAVNFPSGFTSGDESCTRYATLTLRRESIDETKLDRLAKKAPGKVLHF